MNGREVREASKTSAVDAPRQRVSRGLLKVANSLTMLRLLATPALVYLLLNTAQVPRYDWYALALIAVLQATDVLDGFLARQAKGRVRIRTMGEVLDPVAAKLYINSAVIALTWVGRIPAWAGGPIVLRDALILGGWLATYLGTGVRLLPNKLGKAADTFQAALLILILLRPHQTLLDAVIWITVSLTIASGFLYLKGALSARHEARL